ncbi:hypothetical protein [Bdellovibrio sp. HCB337]|uniref:hypothetical protein n=1 Tax=Bdellovibrio sp. HCB337 TaxID=3394358 RepID=UPI0039A439F1
MKSFIFLVLAGCCLFTFSAQAQYTCNDQSYLEQELLKLKRNCGSSGGGLCESRGYKGSTAERAIDACVKNGYPKSFCSQGVTCDGVSLCDSRGYKGSTVEDAVAACVSNGYPESFCNQGVTCEGSRLCDSRGYKGSTVESAVEACVKNGYPESFCNQGVSCN